jgi:hypothetical protein
MDLFQHNRNLPMTGDTSLVGVTSATRRELAEREAELAIIISVQQGLAS